MLSDYYDGIIVRFLISSPFKFSNPLSW